MLNQKFYQELPIGILGMDQVEFPDDEDQDRKNRDATSLIRMITRFIFIWF
jgi:hypothetical protein